MTEEMKRVVKENFLHKEENLAPYATKSSQALRFFDLGEEEDTRPPFYHDADRIIHSLSYTRYMDKTQVFSFVGNDHVSKRIIHVQFVSKIARTIARALNLNEDLTEAIALGHDIGHTPIGHVGESILNQISQRELGEYFYHNLQSVRTYMDIEKGGTGINLTVQVLDGIMCHNGEMLESLYEPRYKTKEEFLEEYHTCYTNLEILKKVKPMTLEGCVVRISDLIGYLGRDIEDAILLGILKREDIPTEITQVLGNTNRQIINTIVDDIIVSSLGQPYIKLSEPIFQSMNALKNFNYCAIYAKANSAGQIEILRIQFERLYQVYLEDILNKNEHSDIYTTFLWKKKEPYLTETNPKRIVLDFMAGMTDEFLLECYQKRK